mmetsp:Transcript_51226/g.135724  ORF Transcript_51226/g.135724 Transcript_51226/m.135724 type:complete len:173 (+) Transcript_51226:32-550(+)
MNSPSSRMPLARSSPNLESWPTRSSGWACTCAGRGCCCVAAVAAAVARKEYGVALPMALTLNTPALLRATWQQVPPDAIPLVAQSLPTPYVGRLLTFLGAEMEGSRHLHSLLLWTQQLLRHHGRALHDAPTSYETALRTLHKGVRLRYDDLASMCHSNQYDLTFLLDLLHRA